MAKITELPAFSPDNVDGEEMLPIVKGGAMGRILALPFIQKLAAPFLARAEAFAGFETRAAAITFAPKMATGETTSVRDKDTGTHAAVAGEVRLDGTAATVGELIPNEGGYTKQASGALWRTRSTERQFAQAWAQSPTAPDPGDPTSKSAKTIAGEMDAILDENSETLNAIRLVDVISGWLLPITDADGYVLGGWRSNGVFEPIEATLPAKASISDIPLLTLADRLFSVPIGKSFENVDPWLTGYLFTITDADGYIVFGVPIFPDQPFVGNFPGDAVSVPTVPTEYENFLQTESKPEFSPNDFAGETQTDRIKAALAFMKTSGRPSRLRLGTDAVTGDSKWVITEAVLLGDYMTLLLDGATLKLANSTFDNLIRNDGIVPDPANPNGKALALNANKNIRIIGINGARVEGPDVFYSAPHPVNGGAAVPWVGDNFGWRTSNVTFANVQGLEVAGFSSDKPRAWSMILSHGIEDFWIHDINFKSNVLNGDGLDVRNGCRNGRIERITGNTHDDIVAICAAVPFADGAPYPMIPGGYESNPLGDDTYNVSIEDISGQGGAGNVVRAFTSGAQGTSLRNISIKKIRQISSGQCVSIGTFGSYTPPVGTLRNITVDDVICETSSRAVYINARLQDAAFHNIWNKRADGLAHDWSSFNRDGSVNTTFSKEKVGP